MQSTKEALRTQWKQNIEQWQASGKTIVAWCQENDISVHVFYYWRKKYEKPFRSFPESNPFVELSQANESDSGLAIDCRGVTVRLSKNFDRATLVNCIQTLQAF